MSTRISTTLRSCLAVFALFLAADTVHADEPAAFDPFEVPEGLSMPADALLQQLGFVVNPCSSGNCFPFTPSNCVDVAVKCYIRGWYQDAHALAVHAANIAPREDAHYLQAASELALGKCDEALATIRRIPPGNTLSLLQFRERINGPYVVRLEQIRRALPPAPDRRAAASRRLGRRS